MHHAEFGAAMQGREHFARIEASLRIKRAFNALLLIEVGFIEHFAHEIAFFDANAMFARQHAANRNAETQNIKAQLFGAFDVAFLR